MKPVALNLLFLYNHTSLAHPFSKIAVLPSQTYVTFPVHKMTYEYNVGSYLAMFTTAFMTVGILVAIGSLSLGLFR